MFNLLNNPADKNVQRRMAKALQLKSGTFNERKAAAEESFNKLRLDLKTAIEAKDADRAHDLYEALGRSLVTCLDLDDLTLGMRLPESLTNRLIAGMNDGDISTHTATAFTAFTVDACND